MRHRDETEQDTTQAVLAEGLAFLKGRLRGGRALIALIVRGELVIRATHTLDPEDEHQTSAPTEILAQARQRGKPLLVLDTDKDSKFRADDECRAAICVPLLDGGHRVLGFLYAGDPTPGKFTYGELNEAASLGRHLGPRLQKTLASDATRPAEASAPSRVRREVPGQLVAAAVVLGVGLLWGMLGIACSGPQPSPRPTSVPPVTGSVRPPRHSPSPAAFWGCSSRVITIRLTACSHPSCSGGFRWTNSEGSPLATLPPSPTAGTSTTGAFHPGTRAWSTWRRTKIPMPGRPGNGI
ncbi:MAG: GAF domain-containing protein [Armatimonadetes bacterium]|nr:GAF domain-containing protein [Armatimonadota bacterium]